MSSTHLKLPARKKPLRVLMVTGIYPTKQKPHSGTFIKTVVDALIAAGHHVEVIHPRPGPVPIRYASAAIQVFLKTLTGQFDIVDGHYGLWCLAARLQCTTPVIANFHGDDLLGTRTDNGGWTKKSLFVIRVSRWLCRYVDGVIVKSEQMKKIALGDNIHVVPSCVDFELFHPIPRTEARATLSWDQDHYYILFGNDPHIAVKNFPLAQAAIESLHKRGISAELVVANGLPQTTLVEYINASNAFILTSIAEGSPTGVKEAMACNVPVVSVNVGDVSQVIGHSRGCKVCSHDPDALAVALEEALLLAEPTTGRSDIAHLNHSVVTEQIIAIYEQVKSKRQRKHHWLLEGRRPWEKPAKY
ncbi:MAG: glycosyltransferase family 4 protein [Ktedonobacteraceae bacterium]